MEEIYQFRQLITFSPQMFSNSVLLQGNQIVLPEFYASAYEHMEQVDGLFVEIYKDKEILLSYAFVYETSATKNACFLSEDLMKKLGVKQGEHVNVRLLKQYQKAQKIILSTQFVGKQYFEDQYASIEQQLYNVIGSYRCIQVKDEIRLQNGMTLVVDKMFPREPFLCLNETDVEIEVNFGEHQNVDVAVKQETNEETKQQMKGIMVGTGEVVYSKPLQIIKTYNPRQNRIKKN